MNSLLNLGDLNTTFLLDLFIALLCGLAVGAERELRNKPAGISTHTTVIAASMIFSYISQIAAVTDPTRIAAQIVSGIGFLGAGIILKSETNNTVHNLTTAASIWYSAAIGMAIGFNFHFMALAATIYILIVNRIPHLKDKSST